MITIQWTRKKLEHFKAVVKNTQNEVFEFEGQEFVKGYALYLIEYLETRL